MDKEDRDFVSYIALFIGAGMSLTLIGLLIYSLLFGL